ncbi:MAG: HNH endonuclease, partial [Proteobacteria bacterium]
IERLQELLSHKNFGDRMDLLFEYVSEVALAELEKVSRSQAVQIGKEPAEEAILIESISEPASDGFEAPFAAAAVSAFSKTEKINRHIPERTKREVWARDGGCCQYRDLETGRVCESRRWVQLDHIIEFSLGGTHDPSNLRLLCGAHNRSVYASRFRKRLEATPPDQRLLPDHH